MKTEKTEHTNILSYCSEDSYRMDGVYSIYYPEGMNIQEEIRRVYDKLTDEEQPTGALNFMLDELIREGKEIDYEVLELDLFDSDYGMFKE